MQEGYVTESAAVNTVQIHAVASIIHDVHSH